MHQNAHEKGWVPSRPEDFLVSDQDKERCAGILMRSALGLWEEEESRAKVKSSGRLPGQSANRLGKRTNIEDAGNCTRKKRRVELGERSLQWD